MHTTTGPWLIAFAALLWAIDAPFRKYLTGGLTSTAIVFAEHLLIALLVLPIFIKNRKELKNMGAKEWACVLIIAFGGSALATVFFTQSFSYVNPSVAILLQKVQPLITILLSAVFLKEKLTRYFWGFALVGIIGAYLVSFPDISISGFEVRNNLGVIFALLAAFLWGASTVFGKFTLRKVSFEMLTALRFLGALLFLFMLEIYFKELALIKEASRTDWLFIFIIAVIAGFVSLFIYYKGLKTTNASIATISELVFPFSAVIINWIFLDAVLKPGQIVGGLILLSGIAGLTFVNARNQNKLENATKI